MLHFIHIVFRDPYAQSTFDGCTSNLYADRMWEIRTDNKTGHIFDYREKSATDDDAIFFAGKDVSINNIHS